MAGMQEAGVPSAQADNDPEGCKHYRRRCKVKAPCCGSFYTCHNCHDEAMLLSNQCSIEMKGSSAENMGRYAVTCVQCKECGTEQDVSNVCISCGIQFANYFCADCKLYATPSSEGIFHCPQCKICRVGKGLGKSHFHCETCQACYTLDSKASHKCVERALESDCPVCMQYLFTSSEALFVGPQCGHALHPACMKQLFKSGTIKCPTCGKPLVDDGILQDALANFHRKQRMMYMALIACVCAAAVACSLRFFRYI